MRLHLFRHRTIRRPGVQGKQLRRARLIDLGVATEIADPFTDNGCRHGRPAQIGAGDQGQAVEDVDPLGPDPVHNAKHHRAGHDIPGDTENQPLRGHDPALGDSAGAAKGQAEKADGVGPNNRVFDNEPARSHGRGTRRFVKTHIGVSPDGGAGHELRQYVHGQTERLRLGVLVTSNRFRPPAMLAKIAATVDIVAHGRLEFGIGAGSRPSHPIARREYDANGLHYDSAADAVASLAEACTIIRRLWTETEPFDYVGDHHRLAGALCKPKPVQRPHPPIVIGGRSTPTMRVVAEHADMWNMPGGSTTDAIERSALLDRLCIEIGRDPAEITRSMFVPIAYDNLAATRDTIGEATDAGFGHIILGLNSPYPAGVARWVADELIAPTSRA